MTLLTSNLQKRLRVLEGEKKIFRAVGGTGYIYLAKGYLYSSFFYMKGCYVDDRAEMFRVGPENWTSNDGLKIQGDNFQAVTFRIFFLIVKLFNSSLCEVVYSPSLEGV